MTTVPAAPFAVESRGLIDRRLLRQAAVTRRYLAGAVGVGMAGTVCLVAQAVLLAEIVERAFLRGATVAELVPLLVGLGGAFLGRAATAWIGDVAAHRTSATVTSLLRRRLLTDSLALGPGWLAGEQTGELSTTATKGVDALDVYFARVLPLGILAALAPLVILGWVVAVDWVSALILACALAAIPLFMVLLGLAAKDQMQDQWRRLTELSSRFLDLVQGLPTLRALRRVRDARATVEAATEDLRQSAMATLRVAFLSSLALEVLAAVGTALVALFLGLRLLNGTVPFSTALAILVLAPEVYLPLRRAAAEFHASTEGQAAAARILDVISEEPTEPGRSERPREAGRRDVHRRAAPDPRHGPVALDDLTVQYPGRSEPSLSHLSCTIEPGEHVAVVGPSGAGKSTLFHVLLGFVPPTSGRVEIAGTDLATVELDAWRRRIAWVPQRPHLVHASLAENIRAGETHTTTDDLWRAVVAAGLEELVDVLPSGLDTPLGDGGRALSAGERQRVAIARAALRDASLVLLDEPTAHVDEDRERFLAGSLAPWLEGRTVLVAAHRPGMVARIDRTIELPARPVCRTDRVQPGLVAVSGR